MTFLTVAPPSQSVCPHACMISYAISLVNDLTQFTVLRELDRRRKPGGNEAAAKGPSLLFYHLARRSPAIVSERFFEHSVEQKNEVI